MGLEGGKERGKCWNYNLKSEKKSLIKASAILIPKPNVSHDNKKTRLDQENWEDTSVAASPHGKWFIQLFMNHTALFKWKTTMLGFSGTEKRKKARKLLTSWPPPAPTCLFPAYSAAKLPLAWGRKKTLSLSLSLETQCGSNRKTGSAPVSTDHLCFLKPAEHDTPSPTPTSTTTEAKISSTQGLDRRTCVGSQQG